MSANNDNEPEEYKKWKKERFERLKSESGWMTLCGLDWLEDESKEYVFGSKDSNPIKLPSGKSPEEAGSLKLKDGKVTLTSKSDEVSVDGKKIPSSQSVELNDDNDSKGTPSKVTIGKTLSFTVIKRSGKLAVRSRDSENPLRLNFKGFNYFPYDPKWVVKAKWIPFNPPKHLDIVNALGMKADEKSSGAFSFEHDGKTYQLETVDEEGSDQLFIIFKDQTCGKESYGFRYLYADKPKNDELTVDFNRTYNPPCAFSDFATCSMPHEQNRLPIRIEAGEKKFDDH